MKKIGALSTIINLEENYFVYLSARIPEIVEKKQKHFFYENSTILDNFIHIQIQNWGNE